MKSIIRASFLLPIFFLVSAVIIQEEPKLVGEVWFLDDERKEFTSLKSERYEIRLSSRSERILGDFTNRRIGIFRGLESDFEINKNSGLRFIVKTLNNRNGLNNQIAIYKLKKSEKESYRYLLIEGRSKINTESNKLVEIDSEPYGESSFLISTKGELEAGEYVVLVDPGLYGKYCTFSVR